VLSTDSQPLTVSVDVCKCQYLTVSQCTLLNTVLLDSHQSSHLLLLHPCWLGPHLPLALLWLHLVLACCRLLRLQVDLIASSELLLVFDFFGMNVIILPYIVIEAATTHLM
jgi:hypothetical protein